MTEAERVLAGLKLAIASFDTDPPVDGYQKGYLAALTELLPKPADVLAEAFVDIGWSTESSNGYRPDRLRAMLAKRGYAVVRIEADKAPKPEPDPLMDAAKTCAEIGKYMCAKDAARQIRAIIAREVAAAEPSDEALQRMVDMVQGEDGWFYDELRAALKGEGA